MHSFTEQDFTGLFASIDDAIEFENQAVSIGDEFLPNAVREVVVNGRPPTKRYWKWLIEQKTGGRQW